MNIIDWFNTTLWVQMVFECNTIFENLNCYFLNILEILRTRTYEFWIRYKYCEHNQLVLDDINKSWEYKQMILEFITYLNKIRTILHDKALKAIRIQYLLWPYHKGWAIYFICFVLVVVSFCFLWFFLFAFVEGQACSLVRQAKLGASYRVKVPVG